MLARVFARALSMLRRFFDFLAQRCGINLDLPAPASRVRFGDMLYDKARTILNAYPRPRVRVVLKSGEVIETPRSLLASVSFRSCAISSDGNHVRVFKWGDIQDFESLTLPSSQATL